jgi:F0F1-type ATP synthase assembly protein I
MTEHIIGKDFEIKKSPLGIKRRVEFDVAKYVSIGYYLVTPMLIGVIVGLYLDSRFKSKPLYILIFLFLGIAGTFYNLWKVTKEIE